MILTKILQGWEDCSFFYISFLTYSIMLRHQNGFHRIYFYKFSFYTYILIINSLFIYRLILDSIFDRDRIGSSCFWNWTNRVFQKNSNRTDPSRVKTSNKLAIRLVRTFSKSNRSHL